MRRSLIGNRMGRFNSIYKPVKTIIDFLSLMKPAFGVKMAIMVLKKGRIGAIKAGLGFMVPNFEIIIAIIETKMALINSKWSIIEIIMAIMKSIVAVMISLFKIMNSLWL
jgi:hypothetical protein